MFAELAHRARESLTPQLMSQLHQQYCLREFKIEDIDADVAIALFSSIANKLTLDHTETTESTTPAASSAGTRTNSAYSCGPWSSTLTTNKLTSKKW